MSDSRERLFAELRRTKLASGLSFARIEARTPYSRASLERYVNGKLWPSRQAVHAIATACDAEPEPLLRLWDEAIAPEPDEPAVVVEPVAPVAPPPQAHRKRSRRWLTVAGAVVAVAVGVVVFVASSGSTEAAPPSTGCRDFYADLRVYTVGRMCWANAEVTIHGDLTNPGEPFAATAQLCVSNQPNTCARRLDLARADKGQTHRYRTIVRLPPGHGTWVRVCLDTYCSDWK
jgi:transcriptional regulator with XRE-family HTH domain